MKSNAQSARCEGLPEFSANLDPTAPSASVRDLSRVLRFGASQDDSQLVTGATHAAGFAQAW